MPYIENLWGRAVEDLIAGNDLYFFDFHCFGKNWWPRGCARKLHAESLIRMNTFWKSKMEEAVERGDMKNFTRAKEVIEALDNFYREPPIKPKAGTEIRDVSKIDLVEIYGDEVKSYIEKGKEKSY